MNYANDIIKSKKALRKDIKEKQRALEKEYTEQADRQICRNILDMAEYKNAKAVFCFVGTKDEIDTVPILEQVLVDGKTLLVPKCHKADINTMDAYEITSLDQLEAGNYGIMEPIEGTRLAEPDEIDFAVIPCLSCDREGHRLGHGGGYYDRYLADEDYRQGDKCFPRTVVCRERLMVEKIPCEKTDQTMDIVVSEEGIFRL